MTPSILLFGANGQVGWQLQRALAPLGELHAFDRSRCDLADPAAISAAIAALRPAIIVNATAYTAVDRAESEAELAQAINVAAPATMAAAAKSLGALLVHYSTDYVFDGSKSAPYVESDATCPLSVYGATKRDGETAILAAAGRALIFRTSWVFGAHGSNFVKTVLRLAASGRPLRIIDDQLGAPTPAELIADVTALAIAHARRGREIGDARLYHLTAANPLSWCGFSREILRLAAATPGFQDLPPPESVTGITTAEYPTPAKRPANSRLDCRRLENDFDLTLPDWRPYLARMLRQIAPGGSHGQ